MQKLDYEKSYNDGYIDAINECVDEDRYATDQIYADGVDNYSHHSHD